MEPEQQPIAPPPQPRKLPKGVIIAIAALGCPLVLCIVLTIISIAGGFFAYLFTAEKQAQEADWQTYAQPAEPAEAYPIPEALPEIPEIEEPEEAPAEVVEVPEKKKAAGKMGELDQGQIKKVIKKDLGRIKYCYERELAPSPTLSGKVVVKFTIGTSGKVTKASIASSSLGNKKVESCVVNIVKKMKFPKPKGGKVVVSYPFIFTRAD
jgi:TonB family protein